MKRFTVFDSGGQPRAQVEADAVPAHVLAAWERFQPYTLQEEDVTAEAALREVHQRRLREYPPLADFVDAYYHQSVNQDATHMQTYLDKVSAVKARHPKPPP